MIINEKEAHLSFSSMSFGLSYLRASLRKGMQRAQKAEGLEVREVEDLTNSWE
jgi:hypothetical protein